MVGPGSGAGTRPPPVAPRPSEGPAQRRVERSAGFPEAAASAPGPAAAPPRPDMQEVSRELRRLQETVARLEQRAPAAVALPPTLRRLEDRMRTMAFSEELAGRVVQQLFHDLDGAALEDRQRVGESASALLTEAMPGSRDIIKIGRRRRVIGFVGASGSGETTAAAKIAAGFAMKRRDRIALITADDKRVGSLDQARAFAEIIGVPLEVAYDCDEMGGVLANYETAQLVLVDTAGCGPHDRQAWDRQRQLLEAAGVDEVQVVIDALTSYDHMLDVIEATEVFPTRRLLFTKMDEVVRPGAVVSAAVRSQIPLSYLVAGPAVPGAIEAADAARLVSQVMGVSGPPTTDRED